ncbi:MAG: hypothetical protein GC154_15335 [bacterium]|nr:hypothetical protein [bacterium]
MTDPKHVTPNEISMYYDGLLSGEDALRVERALRNDPDARRLYDEFACFDGALRDDLADERVEALISDTVQQVHQRLARPAPRRAPGWTFLLAPRFLMAACVAVMLCAMALYYLPGDQADGARFAQAPERDDSGIGVIMSMISGNGAGAKNGAPALDPIQRQAWMAVANLATSTAAKGVETLAENSQPIKQTYTAIATKSDAALALGALQAGVKAIRDGGTNTSAAARSDEDSDDQTMDDGGDAITQLQKIKERETLIGLGASVLGFVTVF